MKITDAVISEFFGKGKGFAVQSIKRWGGFIKDEEDLDGSVYRAIRYLVSARDRAIEFENEVHMVNYMMRCCYWGWCEVLKQNQKNLVVTESQLIPKDADPDFVPKVTEPTCEMIETFTDGKFSFREHVRNMLLHKFGPLTVEVFERTVIGGEKFKDVAESMEKSPSWVENRKKLAQLYLSRKLKGFAEKNGYRKRRFEDIIGRIQHA